MAAAARNHTNGTGIVVAKRLPGELRLLGHSRVASWLVVMVAWWMQLKM